LHLFLGTIVWLPSSNFVAIHVPNTCDQPSYRYGLLGVGARNRLSPQYSVSAPALVDFSRAENMKRLNSAATTFFASHFWVDFAALTGIFSR
jgi:hypothetical protein